MGLKNISKSVVAVQYNGIRVELQPDQIVDVRDFNISNNEVMSVEANLLDKHVDAETRERKLERVKTLSNLSDKQINDEIKRLEEVIEGMKNDVEPREKEILDLTSMMADLQSKCDAAKEYVEKLEALLDEADPKWRKSIKKA